MKTKPSASDLKWAKDKVFSVYCGCILNIRLKRVGCCSKYLYQMSDQEVEEYTNMISQFVEYR